MTNDIGALVRKAERSLDVARRLVASKDYDFSVSRAYYAMFYIAEALLLTQGESFSKHAAVISAVHRLFVKPELLPQSFHQCFNKAFGLRQEGDYITSAEITPAVAQALIDEVETHLAVATALIESS